VVCGPIWVGPYPLLRCIPSQGSGPDDLDGSTGRWVFGATGAPVVAGGVVVGALSAEVVGASADGLSAARSWQAAKAAASAIAVVVARSTRPAVFDMHARRTSPPSG
jgi:hypothetical protein